MGYNTRPELVIQWEGYLKEIKTAVARGTPVKFEYPEGANLSTEQYRLRRALKATELHRNVLGGDYAGLGALVTVKTNAEKQVLEVVPKVPPQQAQQLRVNEVDALNKLESYPGDITLLEFYPTASYSEEEFREMLSMRGWVMHKTIEDEVEEGKLMVTVERESRGRRSDVMQRLGFKHGGPDSTPDT